MNKSGASRDNTVSSRRATHACTLFSPPAQSTTGVPSCPSACAEEAAEDVSFPVLDMYVYPRFRSWFRGELICSRKP